MIDFLLRLFQLKEKIRTGWEDHGIMHPESVADHTFGTIFLTFLFSKEENVEKCLKLALIHDVHEAISGDLPPLQLNKEEKREREKEGFARLIMDLEKKREEIKELWEEYFYRKSEEAQFVRDMDKIEMVLQALFYAKKRYRQGKEISSLNLNEFFKSAKKKITSSIGKKLFKLVERRFQELQES